MRQNKCKKMKSDKFFFSSLFCFCFILCLYSWLVEFFCFGVELRKMSLKGRIIFNSSWKLIWPFISTDFGEILLSKTNNSKNVSTLAHEQTESESLNTRVQYKYIYIYKYMVSKIFAVVTFVPFISPVLQKQLWKLCFDQTKCTYIYIYV